MGVANRELCQRFLDAYRPDGLDDLLALLHPDIEWTSTETWVDREVWHGHAAVRAGLASFFSEWEDFSNDEVEDFRDGGDKFAVVTQMRGRSRGTRIATEMRTSGVFELRDGLIVRIVGHSDPADALAAVATSADAASPPERGAPTRIRSDTGRAMSQENVEVMRQNLDAFNRGDKTAWLATFDPDAEMVPARDWPESAPICGAEAIWDFYVGVTDAWDESSFEFGEVIDSRADKIVANTRRETRGKASGAGVQFSYWAVSTYRNGKAVRVEWFADRSQALEAAGLRE